MTHQCPHCKQTLYHPDGQSAPSKCWMCGRELPELRSTAKDSYIPPNPSPQTNLQSVNKPEQTLAAYEAPFAVALYIFTGVCGVVAALIYGLSWISAGNYSWNAEARAAAGMGFFISVIGAVSCFAFAQIINIIARASHAARQQVILMRQLVQRNGIEPKA